MKTNTTKKIEGKCKCDCHLPGQAHFDMDYHCYKCPHQPDKPVSRTTEDKIYDILYKHSALSDGVRVSFEQDWPIKELVALLTHQETQIRKEICEELDGLKKEGAMYTASSVGRIKEYSDEYFWNQALTTAIERIKKI